MTDATKVVSPSELKENARNVMASPSFETWRGTLQAQLEGRKNEAAVVPLRSMEDALERNFKAGEIAGMLLAIRMWDLLVEFAEIDIARIEQQ